MNYKIKVSQKFTKEIKHLAKKYASIKKDYADLLDNLGKNPVQGTPIGNNCYKIRMAIGSKQKGKSGGARVITCLYIADETLILLTIYDKSERSNITNNEIKHILETELLD